MRDNESAAGYTLRDIIATYAIAVTLRNSFWLARGRQADTLER